MMTTEFGDGGDIVEHLLVHRLIQAGIVLVAAVACIVAMIVIWNRVNRRDPLPPGQREDPGDLH